MNHEEGYAVHGIVFSGNENRHHDVAVLQLFDHGFNALAVREKDLVAVQRVGIGDLVFALFIGKGGDNLAFGDAEQADSAAAVFQGASFSASAAEMKLSTESRTLGLFRRSLICAVTPASA